MWFACSLSGFLVLSAIRAVLSGGNTCRTVPPAPDLLLARRIAACTERRRKVYIHGPDMGRNFFSAIIAHVQAGHEATLHPATAGALFGDPLSVTAHGVALAEACPQDCMPLFTGDMDIVWWHLMELSPISDGYFTAAIINGQTWS